MDGRPQSDPRAALTRVSAQVGIPDLAERLASELSGADLTTLLLEVVRLRAARVTGSSLMRRYGSDRLVAPGLVPYRQLRHVEDALLSALPPDFELVVLSPVAPLGTHSAVATVSQNKVVSTVRMTEVAADPTNALALEAAARRRAARTNAASRSPVKLAALQRVLRAQRFDQPGDVAHFSVFALASAGHDTATAAFAPRAVAEHVRILVDGLLAAGIQDVAVRLSDWSGGRYAAVIDGVQEACSQPHVTVSEDSERSAARGYYADCAMSIEAAVNGRTAVVADGGLVTWTQQLLENRKERLLISGIGVDRVAQLREVEQFPSSSGA